MNKLRNSIATSTLLSLTAMIGISEMAQAAAIRDVAVFNTNTLARNDDGSTGLVPIGFEVNFFGVMDDDLFVNNNGNITLDQPLATFTPFDLTSTGRQIIAPFFADVDTRLAGEPVRYGSGVIDGRNVFGVNYIDVDFFPSSTGNTRRNSFQLILTDRSDIAVGDFDIEYNYDQIQWETGGASGGNDGLGGSSARVGYSNGTGVPNSFLELPGSAVNGAFLDGGINALISGSLNSNVAGRYIFNARNGQILPPDPPQPGVTPEPSSIVGILALGILGGASKFKRKN